MDLQELKELRWAKGKEAVQAVKDLAMVQGKRALVKGRGGTYRHIVCDSASSGCPWYVRLSRHRSKAGAGDWHVTNASLERHSCMGTTNPSARQLQNDSVVWAALSADPSTSASSLVTHIQNQVSMSSSVHVMYRAEQKILAQMFSEDPTTVQLLPSFMSEFQRLNPGTYTEVRCDSNDRFRRAIMVLDPSWFLPGQGLYGVDAAHMKHRGYNGVQLILVSRDGNFGNHVAALALVPVEDYDNYEWFFGRVLSHGFPLQQCPVFSDRNHGLVSAAQALHIFNMFCVRHLLGNMRADKCVRLAVSQDKFVWKANAATTEKEYREALAGLNKVNPQAVKYLEGIPTDRWTLYQHYERIPLYGWRTTNFVESEQAKPYVVTFSSEDVAFVAHVKYPLSQRRAETTQPAAHAQPGSNNFYHVVI